MISLMSQCEEVLVHEFFDKRSRFQENSWAMRRWMQGLSRWMNIIKLLINSHNNNKNDFIIMLNLS